MPVTAAPKPVSNGVKIVILLLAFAAAAVALAGVIVIGSQKGDTPSEILHGRPGSPQLDTTPGAPTRARSCNVVQLPDTDAVVVCVKKGKVTAVRVDG